tara:strand:+ start:2320 stop:2523 length:204 start_codon:yes stop_codon:yes gene_type:complete
VEIGLFGHKSDEKLSGGLLIMEFTYIHAVILFTLLGFSFLGMQLRREYYWLKSIGGFNAFYLEDDDF